MFCRRTLVGSGLKDKRTLRRPLPSLVPKHITHVPENVKSFEPTTNSVTLSSGRTLGYDILVVATGLQIHWGGIKGLQQALADPASGVSSIYSYDTCDRVWHDIDARRRGKAIFTQPADVIKCPGGEYAHSFSHFLASSCRRRIVDTKSFSASKDYEHGLGSLPPDRPRRNC